MIDIHLYGKLRRYAQGAASGKNNVIRISPQSDETMTSLLVRLQIPADEIYSIFFNSKLLAARSGMAHWLGYQQIRTNPFDWNLNIAVKSGDRIGIFGRDMATLVI